MCMLLGHHSGRPNGRGQEMNVTRNVLCGCRVELYGNYMELLKGIAKISVINGTYVDLLIYFRLHL